MISLNIAESKALHAKIVQRVRVFLKVYNYGWFSLISKESLDLDAIKSPEEASRLLREAMKHEQWSRMYKDFATLQLERAQEDALSAEDQLKTAEEYMCLIINTIRCLGFTVDFIDSQTAAVVKIHDSMFI